MPKRKYNEFDEGDQDSESSSDNDTSENYTLFGDSGIEFFGQDFFKLNDQLDQDLNRPVVSEVQSLPISSSDTSSSLEKKLNLKLSNFIGRSDEESESMNQPVGLKRVRVVGRITNLFAIESIQNPSPGPKTDENSSDENSSDDEEKKYQI